MLVTGQKCIFLEGEEEMNRVFILELSFDLSYIDTFGFYHLLTFDYFLIINYMFQNPGSFIPIIIIVINYRGQNMKMVAN